MRQSTWLCVCGFFFFPLVNFAAWVEVRLRQTIDLNQFGILASKYIQKGIKVKDMIILMDHGI